MNKLQAPSADTLERFAAIVGEAHMLTRTDDKLPYVTEQRDLYFGNAAAVLRPSTREQVANIVKIAAETKTALVPQGGNTGLVGGQVPDGSGTQVVVSLTRLNQIRNLDAANNTICVDAGVVLADIQKAAGQADRLFPLSLGSEGSCLIGGNLGSNAGGVNVVRYGNTRDLVLGLEVVLADGRIWDGLKALRKDNTGYDLKNLFIGSEGTLGIITGAVLKLFARPNDTQNAFCGIATPHAALELLHLVQDLSGGLVSSFELISRPGLDLVLEHIPGTRDPLSAPHDWYVLMEISGGAKRGALAPVLEAILEHALERDIVLDGAIAQNETQTVDFWRIREALPVAQKPAGGSIKHDISIPISSIPDFIDEAAIAAQSIVSGCRPIIFGHIGDGNLHYNIAQPHGVDKQAFLEHWVDMNAAIFEVVERFMGSISAEHGIGLMKCDLMKDIKTPVELDLMRNIKRVLDPDNIFNPGKLLPPAD